MSSRPYVANVVKIAYNGTIGPYNWTVIHHATWTGATPSVAALNSFASSLETSWGTTVKPLVCTNVLLTSIVITDLTSSTGNQGIWAGSVPGTNGGVTVGANTCVLVNYPSSFRYRGGHPRTYWPPMDQAHLQDSAHWTSAGIASWVTALTTLTGLYGTLTSGGTNLTGQCAVSYYNETAVPTPPHLRTTPLVMPISAGSFAVSTKVASQRRRIGRK